MAMALDYGYEPEPWMNRPAHNRHSSRKKIKKMRHKKLRRLPLSSNVNSMLKRYTGYEW